MSFVFNRKFLLLCLLSLVVVTIFWVFNKNTDTPNSAEVRQHNKPNILWITVEDMSPHLGSYGDTLVNTPNLDRLAKEGRRYTNVFATAPICSTARSSLITGMYQTSIGTHNHRTTQKRPSSASYLGIPNSYLAVPPPYVKAFTEYLRTEGYYTINNFKTDYQFAPNWNPKKPLTAWDESSEKAHWRHLASKNQPFFAVFNYVGTHESQVFSKSDKKPILDPSLVKLPPYYPDTAIIRHDYAIHLDNISRMDRWVGKLLKQLENDGLADNTIVFFFSDHGDGLPRGKRWVYDSGLQVPLIIRWPKHLEHGTVDDRLISFVDFAPTILSLAGIQIPDHMQGKAFLGKQETTARNYIFAGRDRIIEAYDMRRAVRDKKYKYIHNFEPQKPYVLPEKYRDQMPLMQELKRLNQEGKLEGPPALMFRQQKPEEELFDLQADPYEINNLAEKPEYQELLSQMRDVLTQWQKETGDLGTVPEQELIERMWPNKIQPKTAAPTITANVNSSTDTITVTMNSDTEGASIAYTLDDNQKNPHWLLYHQPLELQDNTSLRTKAIRYGYQESEEVKMTISAS